MPAFTSADEWAALALEHLREHGGMHMELSDPDLSDMLFFVWFNRPPTDATPLSDSRSHTGITDPDWDEIVGPGALEKFNQAHCILKQALANASQHTEAVA